MIVSQESRHDLVTGHFIHTAPLIEEKAVVPNKPVSPQANHRLLLVPAQRLGYSRPPVA